MSSTDNAVDWKEYVEKLVKSDCVKDAAIAAIDGNIYAKTDGFLGSEKEIADIIKGFQQQEILTADGLILGGEKYIYLSGCDFIIRAKLRQSGVHCVKTRSVVIICTYDEPVQPQQAAKQVEQLADNLTKLGY